MLRMADSLAGLARSAIVGGMLLATSGPGSLADDLEELSLEGHVGSVEALAFSPDGTLIASASAGDGTVRVWNLRGERPAQMQEFAAEFGRAGGAMHPAFSPDGRLLLFSGGNQSIEVRDASSGAELAELPRIGNGIASAAFLDGGRLVLGDQSGVLLIVDYARDDPPQLVAAHEGAVTALLPLADGRLISGGADGRVKIWRSVNLEEVASFEVHGDQASPGEAAPDSALGVRAISSLAEIEPEAGPALFVASAAGRAAVYSFSGDVLVGPLAVSGHGRLLPVDGRGAAVIGQQQSRLGFYAVDGGRLIARVTIPEGVGALATHPPTRRVAFAMGGSIKVLHLGDEWMTAVKERELAGMPAELEALRSRLTSETQLLEETFHDLCVEKAAEPAESQRERQVDEARARAPEEAATAVGAGTSDSCGEMASTLQRMHDLEREIGYSVQAAVDANLSAVEQFRGLLDTYNAAVQQLLLPTYVHVEQSEQTGGAPGGGSAGWSSGAGLSLGRVPSAIRVQPSILGDPSASTFPTSAPPSLQMAREPESAPSTFVEARGVLPHDGLYIRRNNQFGTRQAADIRELLSQGIQIDQTLVTFDDFVGQDPRGVPLPRSGETLAVTYGLRPIPEAYKRDPLTTHYLEVALRTADEVPPGTDVASAAPVNYIFVVDRSGSMEGIKLDTVKESVRYLFDRVMPDDILGIVAFDDGVSTVLPAMRKRDIDRQAFERLLRGINPGGGTDLNLGLGFGIDEVSRHGDIDTINQVFLFSDGEPTSGETDWIKIRRNIARQLRDTPARLTAFAYGADANLSELDRLAGVAAGKSVIVSDASDITQALDEEFDRVEHLAAINIQLKFQIDQRVGIHYFYGHDLVTDPVVRRAIEEQVEAAREAAEQRLGVESGEDIVFDEEGVRVFVPDLAVGETYLLVLELALPEGWGDEPIGSGEVQYADAFRRGFERRMLEIQPDAGLDSLVMAEHALKLATSEMVYFALADLYEGDFETARRRLEEHAARLRRAKDDFDAPSLNEDRIALQKFLRLAGNLGRPRSASDQVDTRGLMQQALNHWGQTNNGFIRASFFTAPGAGPQIYQGR